MKSDDTLRVLFGHNMWANVRLLEHCAGLTQPQLDATVPGTYGTIRDTLEHLVNAEASYFSRISTGQPQRRPDNAPKLTIAGMIDSARRSGSGLIEWAPRVKPGETFSTNWEGTAREVPRTVLLTQAINHATEHRSQVMTVLTQLGIQPPELDGWMYFDASDKQRA